MSRDINFRAWSIEYKTMYSDAKFVLFGGTCPDSLNDLFECAEDDDGVILMQFTGLCDKNKKMIFEGDILNVGNNAVVCFSNGRFQPRYDGGRAEDMEDDFWRMCNEIEVIGNIYENADLLQ